MEGRRGKERGWLFFFFTFALILVSVPLDAHAVAASGIPTDPLSARLFGGVVLGAITSPIAVVAWIIFKIASVLLGISGILFNWVVSILVFQFGTYLGNSPGMLIAWGILRDFANIGLLFGFIFLGIATILDLHNYPWKKTLPALIIYAVMLNFSLFITEAVIDGTNLLSSTLYQTTLDDRDNDCVGGSWLDCFTDNGIAGQILQNLRVSSVLGADNLFSNIIHQAQQPIENILKFLMLALLLTIAAVVLFAGTFMLLSRAVVLAFLMVTSPIGFAGLAIPGLQKIANSWWEKLFHQALFAPVFMLLLLVALKMSEAMRDAFPGDLADAITVQNGVANTGALFVYVLIIGFLVAALMVANRFGIYGADLAIRTAGGLTYGTMGLIGRHTLGKYAAQTAQRLHESGRGASGFGRLQLRAANLIAGSAMDGRNITPLKAGFKAFGIDPGKPSDKVKKGYAGIVKANAEEDEKLAKERKDGWKAQDKAYEDTIKQHTVDEERQLARADEERLKAEEERQKANPDAARIKTFEDRAAAFEKAAGERAQQKKDVEEEYEEARKRRMTDEERLVEGYRERQAARAGTALGTAQEAAAAPIREFEEATAELTRAAESMNASAEAMSKLDARLAQLNDMKLTATSGEATTRIENEITATQERLVAAQQERNEREILHNRIQEDIERRGLERLATTAQSAIAKAEKDKANREKDLEKYRKDVRSPDNALEQMARSYERMAAIDPSRPVSSFVVRTGLNADRMNAAKLKIRTNQGKTEKDHLTDAIQKVIDKQVKEQTKEKDHTEGDHGSKPASSSRGSSGSASSSTTTGHAPSSH